MGSVLLDAAGHRRSPATMPGYHRGRPPRNEGEQYPVDHRTSGRSAQRPARHAPAWRRAKPMRMTAIRSALVVDGHRREVVLAPKRPPLAPDTDLHMLRGLDIDGRGERMQVMVIHKTPTLTRERYEAVVRGLTGGKSRLDSPGDVPTGGLLVHVAGETDDGFVIFDVFESQAAFDRFGEFVAPIARAAGIEEPPHSFPLHTYISV